MIGHQLSPIRTDSSNAFAHATMKQRLPQIIDRVIQRNDTLPVLFRRGLQHLGYELKYNYAMPPLRVPAPDADLWYEARRMHEGETWLDTQWFFAETFFFRQIADAVHYWQTGVDPYQPFKQDALKSGTFLKRIEQACMASQEPAERLHTLLELALWGNRVDLSHPTSALAGDDVHEDDLLIDDREQAIGLLLEDIGSVHIVVDNFGAELAMDLFLIDALLGMSIPVVMHVKMQPTYVSDATASDVRWMLRALGEIGIEEALRLRDRLQYHQEIEKLRVVPDFYWNSPTFLKHMPKRISDAFASAGLVIMKGDANYRRATNDTIYPPGIHIQSVIDYMPASMLMLRTLKSDTLAGVDADTIQHLDESAPDWRTNGQRGLIQFIKRVL